MTDEPRALDIGNDPSNSVFSLPLDWITLTTVIYGARGSGKTHFGSVVAEGVIRANQRFCAIDLKGDWWGLKSSADGQSEGLPVVIFGGDHADLPLEEDAGMFIADVVAGLEQSTILDLEQLSKGKQVRFLAKFFERLYDVNREPLLLLCDEAQRYAPQRPMNPDATICLGAVEDLVKLGRKHGLGIVLFTQRGAGLNKEVSELCDMLVAFRTPGPLDQDRIKDWLDANATRAQRDAVMGVLSGLNTGTAVMASSHPGLKLFEIVAVRSRETFDSSATPRIGHKPVEPRRLAQVDLEQLRTRMSAAIERAKEDDPKELRMRIRELEQAKPAATVERIEVPAIDQETREEFARLTEAVHAAAGVVDGLTFRLDAIADRIETALQLPTDVPIVETAESAPPIVDRFVQPRSHNGEVREVIPSGNEQRLMAALAWWRHIGVAPATRVQISLAAGFGIGGSFNGALASLLARNWVEYPESGAVRLTDKGVEHAIALATPPTLDAFHDTIFAKLQTNDQRLLRPLIAAYPGGVSRQELSALTSFGMGGSFNHALSRLQKLHLVRYPAAGRVAACDVLFPDALLERREAHA